MQLTVKRPVSLVIGTCLMLLTGCDRAVQRGSIENQDSPRGAITRVELEHLTNAPGSHLKIYASEQGAKEALYTTVELSSDEARKVSREGKVELKFRNEAEGKTYQVKLVNPGAR